MTPTRSTTTLRLILWPTVLTLLVNAARLGFELRGSVTTASGGRLAPLGISWLVFVFGAWFGWRLCRAGDRPRLRPAWLWSLLAMAGLVAAVALNFRGLDLEDQSAAAYAQLRAAVATIVACAVPLALLAFAVWTRLAWTLLLYAVPARATVLAFTWLAEARGWDTHYTKFGPAGIEVGMAETVFAASVAQLGFWVPYSIVGGTLAGCLAAGLARRGR